jgi:bacterioferritin
MERGERDQQAGREPHDTNERQPFLSDIREIRRRAREHIQAGAVTPSYDANRAVVLQLLNQALATELVCVLRYRRHYFMADGVLAEAIKREFLTHAGEEQAHADQIAERIVQLGGAPDFNPEGLATRSHSEYREGDSSLVQMIKEDLVAERIAIESYREIIQFVGIHDPTTRRMLESVLAKEEEHAEELRSMLEDVAEVLGEKQQRSNGGN